MSRLKALSRQLCIRRTKPVRHATYAAKVVEAKYQVDYAGNIFRWQHPGRTGFEFGLEQWEGQPLAGFVTDRTFYTQAVPCPTPQGYNDFGKKIIIFGAIGVWVKPDVDMLHETAYGTLTMGVPFEMFERDPSMNKRPGETILK